VPEVLEVPKVFKVPEVS